jgi:hypothetical protein
LQLRQEEKSAEFAQWRAGSFQAAAVSAQRKARTDDRRPSALLQAFLERRQSAPLGCSVRRLEQEAVLAAEDLGY